MRQYTRFDMIRTGGNVTIMLETSYSQAILPLFTDDLPEFYCDGFIDYYVFIVYPVIHQYHVALGRRFDRIFYGRVVPGHVDGLSGYGHGENEKSNKGEHGRPHGRFLLYTKEHG